MPRTDNYTFLTGGSIPRVVCTMALPTIASMLVTSLYNMADTFFVGRIDTPSTAAVGIVFSVMFFVQAVSFFFGNGSGNYISRQLGARNRVCAEQMASTALVYALGAGVLIAVVGHAVLRPLSVWLGSTPTILPYTEQYLGISLLGAPLMTGALCINNQMRFQGNARYAMFGILSGAVVNVALDPVLIFGLQMGVRGAALATVSGQATSFAVLLLMSRRGENIRYHWRHFTPCRLYVREILAGGTPSLSRQGLAAVSAVTLNVAAGAYGDAAIAAMAVVNRITMLVYAAIVGLGQGFQPMCGFCYGAGLYGRVRSGFAFCVRVGTAFLTVIAIAGFACSESLISLFRNDPDVIGIGSQVLRFQLLSYPLGAVIITGNMLMQTIRKPWRANLLAAARQGLFFIPLIFILPRLWGLTGLEMCQAVSDALALVVTIPVLVSAFADMRKAEERAG